MQLKLKRSQRETGMLSKTVVFVLYARVGFTFEEMQSISRYNLDRQVIYSSEATKRHLASGAAAGADGSIAGSFKSMAFSALAGMNLFITITSLQQGQTIECKSLDELLGAEQAIMSACQNLKGYLETAATFDGREVLYDFSTGEPEQIASATTPAPKLIAPEAGPIQVQREAFQEPTAPTAQADVYSPEPSLMAATRTANPPTDLLDRIIAAIAKEPMIVMFGMATILMIYVLMKILKIIA